MNYRIVLILFAGFSSISLIKSKTTHDLIGNWKFHEVSEETTNCIAPKPFPIKTLNFSDSTFRVIGLNDTITGNYYVFSDKINMVNALKNGKAVKDDETLKIIEINNRYLTLGLPMECGELEMIFKKIK